MSADAKPTYFSCTLGQVVSLGLQQPHQTINALIDNRATYSPDNYAIGFASPSREGPWQSQLFTFSQIRTGTINLANHISKQHDDLRTSRRTVALLCPSTVEFLFTWLALIRLGHAVLLLAPQLAPTAIEGLCEQSDARLLFYDESYQELAAQASTNQDKLRAVQLPFTPTQSISSLISGSNSVSISHTVSPEDLAYLHHTSGTSTGMPKPIPQSHKGAVGVLPSIPGGSLSATFTTTPLYHGGPADIFRAWTSTALIWLFPGKALPVTTINIVKCLEVAQHARSQHANLTPVRYFCSVPYVLQLLEADERGLQLLQSMELVGVGGAALPPVVGDRLVAAGVKLLSRFGSAECGFLLSSHRHYDADGEWQYLRVDNSQQLLRFEAQDEKLFELIVLKDWPHMAKRNRDDGSYATSDLFEKHENIDGAYRYHSRADSQLTLITGKKFDPAPLEAELATNHAIDDAVIFGNGQPYAGVLLFRSKAAEYTDDKAFLEMIWPDIEKMNSGSQEHAKLARQMLIIMPPLEMPLEKSSKGTLLRGAIEKRFTQEIAKAYDQGEEGEDVKDEDLPATVRKIVTASSQRLQLEDDTDLFSAGVNSVAGIQIRSRLQKLLPKESSPLPMTVVEDCGTISALAKYISGRRAGKTDADQVDELQLMRDLVEQYSHFGQADHQSTAVFDQTIVLTGATGALGAHVLDQYRKVKSVRRIYCLVRGADSHASRERVTKALQRRKLEELDESETKIIVLPAKLSQPDLGLDPATYERLRQEATIILHVAWSVNFRMRLKSFVKDNIAGVKHLLDLALAAQSKPLFGFCSSVASVMAYNGKLVPESILDDAGSASTLGYSRSKWVAEQICASADRNTAMRGRIAIFRVGQLAGDTKHGVWNASEAWPIMLSSAAETGYLPELQDEVLNWLPVDIAATALIQGMQHLANRGDGEKVEILHVVNEHTEPSWMEMIAWLRTRGRIETVAPRAWVEKIRSFADKQPEHPAAKLVSHWEEAFGSEAAGMPDPAQRKAFDTAQTKKKVPVLQHVEAVDEAYFGKLWQWIQEEM